MKGLRSCLDWLNKKSSHQIGLNSSNISKGILKKLIPSSGRVTILDVGANIGEFSKLCREINPKAAIIAVEPQTSCHAQIICNAGEATDIVGKLISNRIGLIPFSINAIFDRKAHIVQRHTESDHGDEGKHLVLEAITLDYLLLEKKIEHVDVLKIDTEGYDLMVLEGAAESLANNKIGVIIFEIMNRVIELGIYPSEIERYLVSHGYKYFYRVTPHLGLLQIKTLQNYEIHTQSIVASKNQMN